jgi:hypothetical protein
MIRHVLEVERGGRLGISRPRHKSLELMIPTGSSRTHLSGEKESGMCGKRRRYI